MTLNNIYNKDNFICPYCEYEFSDCFEWPNNGAHRCSECNNTFLFEKEISIYYLTERIEK